LKTAQELTVRRRLIAVILASFVCTAVGCSDKYSQKRIKMREESMRGLAGDIKNLEAHRRARLREVEPSLRKWWHDDVALFQSRAPTVGDYLY
jgi:hypothetical protein